MQQNEQVLMQSILAKLSRLEKIIEDQLTMQLATDLNSKEYLNIDECSVLLGLSTNQLYRLTSADTIPHFKLGKHLRFERIKILEWVKQQQVCTQLDIEKRAANYLAHHSLRNQ
ncbi:helix-turn-helix domain-containing protein [Shewanella sp. 202IG2-18]|uniref:helix-turn-helix domain-containing protein n=1 Tax=Parashewanella hymeniacidonis TaxID=2807618 RepID=UPI0019603A53|nr:helix-turn-helix domain-containing protein [Parashewanella hymeniacidonis]MBM7074648.1 helix-turn-helix domain-containing protein [Parashewanella hymeniacidonis]